MYVIYKQAYTGLHAHILKFTNVYLWQSLKITLQYLSFLPSSLEKHTFSVEYFFTHLKKKCTPWALFVVSWNLVTKFWQIKF